MLAPRYDGPTILTIDGSPGDQRAPFTRQRRRLEATLRSLTDDQWDTPSRCDGWTVRDVVAHVAVVNSFWHLSILSGLRGTPTRFIANFDPAASPPAMVASMGPLSGQQVLDKFASTNNALLEAVEALDDAGWSTLAEAPPGHIAIRLLVQHALWDSWIHERDVAIPLGLACVEEDDEVRSCLQYAAVISPALALGLGQVATGTFAVAATNPDVRFVVEVGDCVTLRSVAPDDGTPLLRGDAVALVEALSLRAPMPDSAPVEWTRLLNGLQTAFDAG